MSQEILSLGNFVAATEFTRKYCRWETEFTRRYCRSWEILSLGGVASKDARVSTRVS